MKLKLEQLPLTLKKNLASIYWVMGDEPWLVMQAVQHIREATKAQEFAREVLYEDKDFEWELLTHKMKSLGLFSTKILVELKLTSAKLNEAGWMALSEHAEHPSPDKILLIISPKLESSQQRSKGYKKVEAAGVCVPIWPLTPLQLPQWVNQQLLATKLKTSAEGIALLAKSGENNLLSIAQSIEKLSLIYGEATLNVDQIREVVSDQARFDVYDWSAQFLMDAPHKAMRILSHLENQGVEPAILLWAMMRELRQWVGFAFRLKKGESLEAVLSELKMWETQKQRLRKILTRYSYQDLLALIPKAAELDRRIKGIEPGNVWEGFMAKSFLC